MELDFTRKGRLDRWALLLLNKIAEEHRGDVVACIDELGRARDRDVDWWVSELASRNTFTSPFFTWCCQALLVARALDQRQSISEIRVDAWPLYRVVRQIVRARGVNVRVRWSGTLRDRFAWRPRAPWSFARALVELICARLNPPHARWAPQGDAVLLDVFVYDHSFPNGEYDDRYYNGFSGSVDDATWQSMAYWPTFHTTLRRTWSIIRTLRRSTRRFVLTQDFVGFSDVTYAWFYPFRALKHRPRAASVAGIDVTPIARAIWRRHLVDASAVDALLKFRFARRLAKNDVRLRLVVDWFENQCIDKGATIGIRRFHPQCEVVGYQGYIIPRHYLGMYPSRREHESGVLPHWIAVIGRGFVDERREFCPALDVRVAPAFRFAGVWRPRSHRPDPAFTTVLVALHLSESNSAGVLRAITEAIAIGVPSNSRIWIRPHPAAPPLATIADRAGVALPKHEIATGDFTAVLEQADILVSNTSSTCVEALAKGVPVAVVGSSNEPAQNPIPAAVPNDLWRVCFTANDLAAAIRELPGVSMNRCSDALTSLVRSEYFEPVTQESVRALLRLDTHGGRRTHSARAATTAI